MCLLNTHIRARMQCVAGSKSKIPENLSCYSHALNKLNSDRHLPGSTQATCELPPPRIRIQYQQYEGNVNRAIWHISPGSNTLHTFIYSPSIHMALNIGAIIRRTTHHSKVISISHLQNVISNTLSFISTWYICLDCTRRYSLENGPISMPTFSWREFYTPL